jgi:hypothetical protein
VVITDYLLFVRIIDGNESGCGEMVGVGGWMALGGRDVALQRPYGNAVVLNDDNPMHVIGHGDDDI